MAPWLRHFMESVGLRKPEAPTQPQATQATDDIAERVRKGIEEALAKMEPAKPAAPVAALPVAAAPTQLVPVAAPPVAAPPVAAAPPAAAPPAIAVKAEFDTHPDGTVWWNDPIANVERGPCDSEAAARKLADAVLANYHSRETWTPGEMPQIPWPSDDPVAVEFDRLWASGPDGEPRLFTVGQMRAYYWATAYNQQAFEWYRTHQAAIMWHKFAGSSVNMRRWTNFSDQESPDAVYQRAQYAAEIMAARG